MDLSCIILYNLNSAVIVSLHVYLQARSLSVGWVYVCMSVRKSAHVCRCFSGSVEEKTWSRHLSISCTSLPSRPFCSHSSQWGRCGQALQFLWFNRVNKTQKMEQNWTVEAQDKKKEKYHLSLFTDLFISLHKCPSLFSGLSTIHDSYICYVWWLRYSSTSAAWPRLISLNLDGLQVSVFSVQLCLKSHSSLLWDWKQRVWRFGERREFLRLYFKYCLLGFLSLLFHYRQLQSLEMGNDRAAFPYLHLVVIKRTVYRVTLNAWHHHRYCFHLPWREQNS